MNKKQKQRGMTVTTSKEAHEAMSQKAFNHKPRLSLREYVNIINGLPKEK